MKDLIFPMKFDTHTHTHFSPCSGMSPRELVDAAEKHLNVVVVCDHNEVDGALAARKICIEETRDLIVELGIECTTEFGELGLKFLTDEECDQLMGIKNKAGKFDFEKVVGWSKERRSEGSLHLRDLHHPFDFMNPKRGFDFKGVKSGFFYSIEGLMQFFDFTEMNTASMSIKETQAALELAKRYKKPIVCSTDSHFPAQIGRYFTKTTHTDARQAILDNNDLVMPSPEEINYWRSRLYRFRSKVKKTLHS